MLVIIDVSKKYTVTTIKMLFKSFGSVNLCCTVCLYRYQYFTLNFISCQSWWALETLYWELCNVEGDQKGIITV